MKTYLEHTVVPVADLDWSLKFFADVFGMTERRRKENTPRGTQVWLTGGLQLVERQAAGADETDGGWNHHLGLMVSDLEAATKAALAVPGVHPIEDQPAKWVELPDGTVLELFQAPKE